MKDSRKSDKDAKEAYIEKLQSEGYSNIKVISKPADIIASKDGQDFYFEIKKTERKDIYFGAATLTEWVAAIDNTNNYFFVIAIKLSKNKWKFEQYTPHQFMEYSSIPPFKFYFIVPISEKEKSKKRKKSRRNVSSEIIYYLKKVFKNLDDY